MKKKDDFKRKNQIIHHCCSVLFSFICCTLSYQKIYIINLVNMAFSAIFEIPRGGPEGESFGRSADPQFFFSVKCGLSTFQTILHFFI